MKKTGPKSKNGTPKSKTGPPNSKSKKRKKRKGHGRPKLQTDAAIIKALKKFKGRVALASRSLGYKSHKAIYIRAEQNEEIRDCITVERMVAAEKVDGKMFEKAMAGDNWCMGQIVNTFGKHLGYGQAASKIELTGKDGGPIEYEDASIEQKRDFLLGILAVFGADGAAEERGEEAGPALPMLGGQAVEQLVESFSRSTGNGDGLAG